MTVRPGPVFDRDPDPVKGRRVVRMLASAGLVAALIASLAIGLSRRPVPPLPDLRPSSPPSQGSPPPPPPSARAEPSTVAGSLRWTLVSAGGESSAYSVTDVIQRRDGTYLAVAFGQEARVLRSDDGRTWSVEPGDPGLLAAAPDYLSLVTGLAEGPDGVVAVGSSALLDFSSGDARSWSSSDGLHWEAARPSRGMADAAMEGITSGPDGFVAVGSDGFPGANVQLPGARGAATWTSADGESWTRGPSQDSYADAIMRGVVRIGAGYIAWGQTIANARGPFPAPVWTSPDGIRWDRASGIPDVGGPGTTITSIVALDDRMVAVGSRRLPEGEGGGSAPGAWTSSDAGRTWSPAVVADPSRPARSGGIFDVATDGKDLIAVGRLEPPNNPDGRGRAAVWRSADQGASWRLLPDDSSFSGAMMSRIVVRGSGDVVFGAVDDPNAPANVALIWIAERSSGG
ncbi:MAG TPA: sialidase family protein [Candidatus Limnocylindrales bacterium]|nr:sialidase family protein [Candidatus Limnocylindrales bacterium]